MKLREYQTPQVNKLIRQLQNSNEAALISAVGTGKTLVGAVVGDELIKRGIVKKVIVSAPFNTIVKEFPEYSGKKILSGSANNSQYLIGKIEQSPNIKTLIDVITGNSSEFVSTSHHAMANHRVRTAVNQADDLSDLLLVIDEAHHCFTSDDEDEDKDGTLLGEIAEKIKDRGGKILYVTATPYRTVGAQTNLIFDPLKCNPVIRTIGEQMRDGYAPSLNTEYIHVRDVKLTNAGDGGVFGDLANTRISDPQLKTLLPRIVKQWRSEKYPKTILLVPAGNADHTAVEVKKYLEEISFPHDVAKTRGRKHPSVLISVGDSGQVIEVNGKEMTEIECDKASGGRVYDIVIGCRKFDEGTDVSSASHIFMVGLPSSVRLFHQRTGRVLRDKKAITGYAEWFGSEWLDKSKVVFFAPVGKKTKAFDYKVGRQLLHCIFAAESYQEYCESLNASQNIRIAFENKHKKAKCEASREELEYAMALMGEIELNELKDYSSNEFDELIKESLNPEMTVGERIDLIKSSDMTDAERVIALNNIVNHLPDDIKQSINWDAIVNSIVKSVKKKKVAGFDIPPVGTISDVFDDVLREFYNVKITTNTERAVQQVFSSLSGETFKEWAEKCSRFMGEDAAIMMTNKVCDFMDTHDGNTPSANSIDMEEQKLANWVYGMRQAKAGSVEHGGRIFYDSVEPIAVKRGYSDIFNFIDLEKNAIDVCKDIIEYYSMHGKYPSKKATDIIEKRMGAWLGKMRSAKKGNGGGTFYPILQQLAIDADLPDMFDNIDLNKHAIDMCNKVIAFYNVNKQLPSQSSDDVYESKISKWLQCMRGAKNGSRTGLFRPILQVMADSAGIPTLFDRNDNEQRAVEICNDVIKFYSIHGKYPSCKSSNTTEHKLGRWLTRMRSYKNDKNVDGFYPILQTIAIKSNHAHMFDIIDRERICIDKCNEVIQFYKMYGKYPSTISSNADEKRLGRWLSNMRGAKLGTNHGVFYDSIQQTAENAGLPKLFDKVDLEQIAIDTCNNVIEFYKTYNKIPSESGTTEYERKLGKWISYTRKTKQNVNNRGVFYPIVQVMVDDANIPNLFNSNWKDDLK